MKFENVAKLTAILKDDFALMGSFVAEYGPADAALTVVRRQTGVIRTNCIDCLDRTGVAQSAFARWVLAQHLAQFGSANEASACLPTSSLICALVRSLARSLALQAVVDAGAGARAEQRV